MFNSIHEMGVDGNAFSVSYIILTTLTTVVHGIGILLLVKIKSNLPNQRIIVINLALSELLFCLLQALIYLLKIADRKWRHWDKPDQQIMSIYVLHMYSAMAFNMATRLFLIYIINDRFMSILLHMKYIIWFPKHQVLKIVIMIWLLALMYGTVLCSLAVGTKYLTILNAWTVHNFANVLLDSIIVVSGIGTYIYFYKKVRAIAKSTKAVPNDATHVQTTSSYTHKFILPFLIVLTYIIFNISATIIYQIRLPMKSLGNRQQNLLKQFARILVITGFLSDSLLYIFVQKQIRRFVCRISPTNLQGAVIGNPEVDEARP